MSDNRIKVSASTSSKPIRVNVSVPASQGAVTLSKDTSAYNANLAQQWAVSENIVLGQDYSSKYYANKAKESASNAQGFEQATRETYNSFSETAMNANNQIETAKKQAITEINTRFEEGVGDGVNQITVIVDESIAEYTEISNEIKQSNSQASEQAQYWAEKAKDNSGIFYDELADEDIDVEIITGEYATKSDLTQGLDRKQDKGDYATRDEVQSGLDTKQAKGNYALKTDLNNFATKSELPTQVSELENDSNFATQTQVLQAIASIPQFSLSIVNELPTTGAKMTLYLVPKEGTNNDVYDEYIWIEQTSSFEHLGTTAVDLTDYVKNTDYATTAKAGVIKSSSTYGFFVNETNGIPYAGSKGLNGYQSADKNSFIGKATLENIKNDLVKRAVTENDIELTDDEKASARTWLGAVGDTDYATDSKGGVVKTFVPNGFLISNGLPICGTKDLNYYNSTATNNLFVSKGTLNNVLTQYSKTVLTTEADYNALATKDSNTLYLIEE